MHQMILTVNQSIVRYAHVLSRSQQVRAKKQSFKTTVISGHTMPGNDMKFRLLNRNKNHKYIT